MNVLTDGSGAQLSAGSRPYRATESRLSLADHGPTCGCSTARGICLLLREQVRGIDPFGLISHPGLTLTVAQPRRFAATVCHYAGLPASGDEDSAPA